jgi:hypothetical protein
VAALHLDVGDEDAQVSRRDVEELRERIPSVFVKRIHVLAKLGLLQELGDGGGWWHGCHDRVTSVT